MIGLVVVSHGKIALELVKTTEHIVGEMKHTIAISIEPDDDMELKRQEIISAVDKVNVGNGVVLMTDMFGGTPANLAISMLEKKDVDVISGVNLPLLIKFASTRSDTDIGTAIMEAEMAGRKYINVASKLLSQKDEDSREDLSDYIEKYQNFLLAAQSLESQLKSHLENLARKQPNDKKQLTEYRKLVNLLQLILDGLREIISQIELLLDAPEFEVNSLNKTINSIESLAGEIDDWWENNRADAVDWCIRFPAIGAAIGLLNFAGANSLVATAAAVAAIGGPKLYDKVKKNLDTSS